MIALPNIVDYAVPIFVLLILAEMIWARKRKPAAYEPKDTLTSLSFGLGSTVVGTIGLVAVLPFSMWLYDHRVINVPWTWWAFALCFVLDDLAYYVSHRASHRIRWFWASHVNHHSSQHYNLSTALRQTWTGYLSFNFMFRQPLILLGFHPMMLLFVGGLNLIYQFWIHTEVIDRCPRWFEAVMNTPSHHRVHHATNPRYLDHNYAGVFIIWDKLFGSFTPELADEKCRYGIVKNLGTFNLLWSVFHEWVGIARDLWTAPMRYKLHYLMAPPGWSHDGSRNTSDMIRARWMESDACQAPIKHSTLSSSAADRAEVPLPDALAKAASTVSA
jgi:sterol desaturase/sphingolipid hydroxylase (fatty acid hydroxylase superfamily)